MLRTKRCIPWLLAIALGCGESKSETPLVTTPFVDGDRFCVPEAMTVSLPPDRQRPIDPPLGKCGNYLGPEAIEQNTISCGPCGFVLDRAVTERVRATKPDACCYEVPSPPPPARAPE